MNESVAHYNASPVCRCARCTDRRDRYRRHLREATLLADEACIDLGEALQLMTIDLLVELVDGRE